ncbi:protein MULTIPLE CHLOROPLAST DIVISION SITE 1 [Malania oleifera]|uniref:protein MULTIPLE CHLOROPLAST DIVISION SITE 1 n=1 Tax=Malania oleifera TaxID=397392 RepID=UPI0025AEC658|nr:protein MULTIPLE CHLOROPLAST DIVISION SITE 1 [Malania oleifera]
MASMRAVQFHPVSFSHRVSSNALELRPGLGLCYARLNWYHPKITHRSFTLRASSSAVSSDDVDNRVHKELSNNNIGTVGSNSENPVHRMQEAVSSLPPVIFVMRRHGGTNLVTGLCIATIVLFITIRVYVRRRSRYSRPGSVADLVRRGQLRSDRRGISKPLKYEDPFNNPMVKVHKSNSTVEMCGKVYRLAPVTLTKEEQAIHQKRRSRAYQWKRPTVFLKEGDSIPPDVDPDTVRWIPANHPFATIASELDEDLAQNNVYQKHGVPFRIQAEHEALQKKLEALQNDQKLNNVFIDPANAKDFERPFKSQPKSRGQVEQGSSNSHMGNCVPPESDCSANSVGSNPSSEDMQKP